MYLPFARRERLGPTTTLGPIEQSQLGPVIFSSYAVPPKAEEREPRTVDVSDSFVVTLVSFGGLRWQQGSDSLSVGAGQLVVSDGKLVGDVESTTDIRTCTLRFPKESLVLGDAQAALLSTTILTTNDAVPAALRAIARQISIAHGRHAAGVGDRLGQAVIDLTAALALQVVGIAGEPESVRRGLVARCAQHVEAHLRDPALSPATIAAALHISVRSLHLAFETEETTVARLILRRRLERARRDLDAPAGLHASIASIGSRWGFASASHFSRVFKGFYGVSPIEWRLARFAPSRSLSPDG
jgi:AraC-like DNA-binding protein